MKEINKQLQERIGELIGKDYFELEFGCKFINNDNKNCIVINEYSCSEMVTCSVAMNEYYFDWIVEDNRCTKEIKHFSHIDGGGCDGIFPVKEIIGTEPTLNDLLLALSKKIIHIECQISNGNLQIYKSENYEFETLLTEIDLSQSLFNQAGKVKQKLLELLNSK